MFTFTIENCEFLNDFYKELKLYVKTLYGFTAKILINPTLMEEYKEQEKLTLILLNKSIYQNIFNMMAQLDNNMVFSSLSCLENALYNIRLFNVLKNNRNNLYKYMTDENFDLKKCEEVLDKNTDIKDKNEFSVKDFYKEVKNTNRFDDIKSIMPLQIHDGNLYMGLSNGNELSDKLQDKIRGYLISMYRALSAHNQLFFNGGIDKDVEELEGRIYRKFMEYIKLYV
ncbi:MAG: hypothetical protein J1E41_07105 [Ruminococcus sp.]|nr:hypothetical protein [Ruminococcus sp.]